MSSTPIRQKIGLWAFGIFLTFVLLEVLLRLGGFIFYVQQSRANKTPVHPANEYVILCLGESTTALGGENSYPRQLENILNERQDKIKFKVINKGIPATTTAKIVQNLPVYLSEYKPNMVITMIGVNDALTYIHANAHRVNSWLRPFYELRTVKLVRLLTVHLKEKSAEENDQTVEEKWKKLEAQVTASPTAENFTQLARYYRAANRPSQEFQALQKALVLNPRYLEALQNLGEYHKRQGDYASAIESFQKVLGIGPPGEYRINTYADLAESYKLKGSPQEAEEVFRRAMVELPKHPGAYGGLGDLYLEQGRLSEASELFERQIEINPQAHLFYGKLAYCYRQEGQKEKALNLLKEGIRHNPKELTLYTELAYSLVEDGKDKEAEDVIKQAVNLTLEDSKGVVNQWFRSYVAQGKKISDPQLQAWFKDNHDISAETTLANYQKVRDILLSQKIKFVVVQYPMRNILPLRQLFSNASDIVFVDNERSFKEAVSKEGYDVYFSDRFAGDFGHCTVKGNALLAKNIADSILALLEK